jgi:ABC-type Fe3+-hydroxamate transport system substrate-binding protein
LCFAQQVSHLQQRALSHRQRTFAIAEGKSAAGGDSVIDVGLRTEPNLELLTQMKPSFIVWSAGYGP